MEKRNFWTEDHILFLKENYESLGADECAKILDRTQSAVYKKANRLNLRSFRKKPNDTPEIYENKLFNKEIDLIPLEPYIDSATPILHECIKGHRWKAIPRNVLMGTGCPLCAESGYDSSKPGRFYYIRIKHKGQIYYKVGITNRTISKRFSIDMGKIDKVLLDEYHTNGRIAFNKEKAILSRFNDFRLKNISALLAGGNTELFEQDILNLDNNI